jgi:hypothetical protein
MESTGSEYEYYQPSNSMHLIRIEPFLGSNGSRRTAFPQVDVSEIPPYRNHPARCLKPVFFVGLWQQMHECTSIDLSILTLRSLPKILISIDCKMYPIPAYKPINTISADFQPKYQPDNELISNDASSQAGQYPSTGSIYSKGTSCFLVNGSQTLQIHLP